MEFSLFLPHLAYLEIDSMIFFPTLVISLAFHVKRMYKSLITAIGTISPIYIVWDFLATLKGSWGFNPKWVLGIYVVNLPVEEVLFFVVTPFATLLIYDFLFNKFRDKELRFVTSRKVVGTALVILLLDFLFLSYSYTFVDLVYLSASLLTAQFLDGEMLRSRNYWVFVLLTFIPFLVFDYFLTSLPVVVYGTHSILGIRILTIPVEDAIYSLSMMNFYTSIYRVGAKVWSST
ncbi:lycopene cyclase domain-containing protein [Metallosphaera tengchongensis]|uniref:Lycopene cyclase domain-containing protein n=1 Tax=Metallosphaera tengchongensis TaxID=1532350 RepID=A0A6N0NXR5_9CREN|nr:lycopene cyclase domain-containing protein [Metallosphaera tengchongensis]QKR00663.1 lycopene cyclase domain-containing protein [Metallosphaera tengchongensis]